MTRDQERMRAMCPVCQEVTGGTAPCSCNWFCGDVLCQHADFGDFNSFSPPPVPQFARKP